MLSVWQKRLGPSAAPDRWARHGRGLWWLIRLDDGDPLLAFPSASNSSSDPSSAYLELNSVALQPSLGSVFNNPLIAEQLNSLYGLPHELGDVLLAAPFVLRVNTLEAGRFQASIQAR